MPVPPRHFQTDNSSHGEPEMFNENWKQKKTTEAQQIYAETLSRFDDDQLEDEYFSTMLQISETHQQILKLPIVERPAAETQAKPVLDNLATCIMQILTEANSRRQWPVPVNPSEPHPAVTGSLQKFKELVNAMDEAELETELQSCLGGVKVAQQIVNEIQAANDGDVEGNSAFEIWSHTLKIREENLQAVRDEIHQRQQNAKQESLEEQRKAIMKDIQVQMMESWLNEAGDLTEIVRTAMSFTLRLASLLPTEGRYEFKSWRYHHFQDKAQATEDHLLIAYESLKASVEQVEWAIRRGDAIRGMLTDNQSPEDQTPRSDDIPF